MSANVVFNEGSANTWYATVLLVTISAVSGSIPFNPDLDRATGASTNNILWDFFGEHRMADNGSELD